MATIGERTTRNETQIEEIRTHFATKADLERGLRWHTGIILVAISIAVAVIVQCG